MAYAYAILGALLGVVLIYWGVGLHPGQSYLDGLPAYAFSALTGGAAALGIRYAIQRSAGPIIP